jgi:DUF971 family protein
MAGLTPGDPTPTEIILHQQSRRLEVAFSDGQRFVFSFEMLRVYSPSAEVRGHGPGQEVLQTGKEGIGIEELEAVGHYAVKPIFTDGHDTGIYSWDYLYFLGSNQDRLWQEYLERLEKAKASRSQASPVGTDAVNEIRRR